MPANHVVSMRIVRYNYRGEEMVMIQYVLREQVNLRDLSNGLILRQATLCLSKKDAV